MIALFISSIVSCFLFIILGTVVAKIAGFSTTFTEKMLVGLVVSNTITTTASLFVPIGIYILIALSLCCCVLVIFIQDELKSLFSLAKTKKIIVFYSLPFILIAFIISLDLPQAYDSALYHIQNIKWIEEYAVIPGLANLHGRFGVNPNIFTLFSLTAMIDLFRQEIFSVNFTLFAVLVLYFVNKLHSIFKQEGITNIFIYYSVIFITILNLSINLSSPTPDFVSIAFPLFVLASIYKPKGPKENTGLRSNIPILLLCVYTLTVKLAALPLMILAICIFIKYKEERRTLLWTFLLFSLITIPWLIRNIILTGWLVYPLPSLDLFSFDWKVPLAGAINERVWITGWARNPGPHAVAASAMSIFEWFPLWWDRLSTTNKLWFVAATSFPVVAFIGHVIKIIKLDFHTFIIIITSFVGVLFWLMLAPDLRFGKAFLTIAAISPLLFLKFRFKRYRNPVVFYCIIIAMLFYYMEDDYTRYNLERISYKNSHCTMTPQIIQIPPYVKFKTYNISGFSIFVPTVGDQCYNHNLPCTPYPDSTLVLRNNTLQSGFKHTTAK